jgi:hypothetical protein
VDLLRLRKQRTDSLPHHQGIHSLREKERSTGDGISLGGESLTMVDEGGCPCKPEERETAAAGGKSRGGGERPARRIYTAGNLIAPRHQAHVLMG